MNFSQREKSSQKDFDQVFLVRSKLGSYVPLDLDSKLLLHEKYKKNPRPSRVDLEEYSRVTGIPLDKIQNFFKYQRKLALKTGKLKPRFPKHCFSKQEKDILEKAFRENPKLDDNTKNKLMKRIGCEEVYIRRWFNYRNKKLEKIKIQKPSIPQKTEPIKTENRINDNVENLWFSAKRTSMFQPLFYIHNHQNFNLCQNPQQNYGYQINMFPFKISFPPSNFPLPFIN